MDSRDFLATLRDRGFVAKTTDDETEEKPLAALLRTKRVTGYIGFDPTAPSLHVGNLVAIMGLVHLQRCGHRPLVILGGGTGRIGDPSGKTELRKVLGEDDISLNLAAQRLQFARYLELATGSNSDPASSKGIVLDNAEWLAGLNYIEFLRNVGRHFSVNRMLAAESVQLRLESKAGLSFLEFNYSLLQAYDFLVLSERHDCALQMGGSDQWGNIVAGADLVRRVLGRSVHGVTFPLITTADGRKMGKSEKGAVWLDPSRTSPYEFYQFWINTDDRDVGRFLRMFTLLELERIRELEALIGAESRKAKEVLAFEATLFSHGREAAEKAREASRSLFGSDAPASEAVPSHAVDSEALARGIPVVQAFADAGLSESKSKARQMARQGGVYVNGESVPEDRVLTTADLRDGGILLRAGKKKYARLTPR